MIKFRFCVAIPVVLAYLLAAVTADPFVDDAPDDDAPDNDAPDDDDNRRHPWRANGGASADSGRPN